MRWPLRTYVFRGGTWLALVVGASFASLSLLVFSEGDSNLPSGIALPPGITDTQPASPPATDESASGGLVAATTPSAPADSVATLAQVSPTDLGSTGGIAPTPGGGAPTPGGGDGNRGGGPGDDQGGSEPPPQLPPDTPTPREPPSKPPAPAPPTTPPKDDDDCKPEKPEKPEKPDHDWDDDDSDDDDWDDDDDDWDDDSDHGNKGGNGNHYGWDHGDDD
jgi:hypothetical protein